MNTSIISRLLLNDHRRICVGKKKKKKDAATNRGLARAAPALLSSRNSGVCKGSLLGQVHFYSELPTFQVQQCENPNGL